MSIPDPKAYDPVRPRARMAETKRCIRCLRLPATVWIGYVTRPRRWKPGLERIYAGWCVHCKPDPSEHGMWRGHWLRRMGLRA